MDSWSQSTSEEDPRDYEQMPAGDKPGYIYVIREKETAFYKIGMTNNPTKRISDLKSGNPRRLIFKRIIVVPDRRQAEGWLHGRLNQWSVRGGGTEWFQIPYAKKQELYEIVENEMPQFINAANNESMSEGSWW